MLGMLIRFAVIAAGLVGLVLLFLYAAVVALIFVPVALIAFFLLRRRGVVQWTTVDLRAARAGPARPPTVIDHDPNDVTLTRPD